MSSLTGSERRFESLTRLSNSLIEDNEDDMIVFDTHGFSFFHDLFDVFNVVVVISDNTDRVSLDYLVDKSATFPRCNSAVALCFMWP